MRRLLLLAALFCPLPAMAQAPAPQSLLALVPYGQDLGLRDRLIASHAVFADLSGRLVARLDEAEAARLGAPSFPAPGPGEELCALVRTAGLPLPPGTRLLYAAEEFLLVAAPPELVQGLGRPGLFHGGVTPIALDRPYLAPATFASPIVALAVDPRIAALAAGVSKANLTAHVTALSALYTRHSTRPENAQALDYVKKEMAKLPGWTVKTEAFSTTYGPNVIAELPGLETPAEIVMIGGHLDSITFSGSAARAPGADDNATGSATVLELARLFTGFPLQKTLRLGWWNAEEQGLIGSNAYATAAKNRGDKILAYLNTDMNAYRASGARVDVAFITNDSTASLIAYLTQISLAYVPGLAVESGSFSSGSSDHRSFFRNGFPAVFFFEDLQNYSPYIHSGNDTLGVSANDMDLATLISQSILAGAASIAEPLPESVYTLDVTTGPAVGGTLVKASGSFLAAVSEVKVGGRSVPFARNQTIDFVTPAAAVLGQVQVELINPAGPGKSAFTYTQTAPPALRLTPRVAPGNKAEAALGGAPGDLAITLLSALAGPTPIGLLTLDIGAGNQASLFPFHLATLSPASGTAEFTFPVPADPVLNGALFHFQGVLVDPALARIQKTNAAPLSIR